MSESGGTFTATVPATTAGFKGVEVDVVAQDVSNSVDSMTHTLTVNNVPVTIADVTRYIDTLDIGPFSVHAVVAGIDFASGGKVELLYTVNGGTSVILPMAQTITGTSSPLQTNSNIYMEKIPAVNAGDKVCYSVQASNSTSTAPVQSPQTCFEVLQPAAPLGITPSSAVMVIDDSPIEFIAGGGYGTYGWNTLNGTLSTTLADKTVYTPTLSGWDKLSVKDLKGFTATVVINVLPALTISPAVDGKRFSPSSVVQLTASGAESPYIWKIEGATPQVSGNDNETVVITLGADPATIKVTLTDAAGRTKTALY
jgi:hypothetical protein